MSIIEVRNLYKVFGSNPKKALDILDKNLTKEEIFKKTNCTVAINEANFKIKKGEIFVIMGLSGSGKSTIIRCLNRLIEPTSGEILLDGENILEMDKKRLREIRQDKISMVFQHFGLFPHRSVLENVEYGLEIAGIDQETRRKKAIESLELVGLEAYKNSRPNELSGGMQQRVGLARALANDPEILLMDEAFSALDPLIRTQMQDELIDLQDKMHKTIVFITHDLDEALKLGDRIAILAPGGKISQIGTPEAILTDPADDYVKSFVNSVDITKVIKASSIMKKSHPLILSKDGPKVAIRRMEQLGTDYLFVTDNNKILKGIITVDKAVRLKKEGKSDLTDIIDERVSMVSAETSISDLLTTLLQNKLPIAVVENNYKLLGYVDRATIIAEVGDDNNTVMLSDSQELVWKKI